jgi:hypothetical protein
MFSRMTPTVSSICYRHMLVLVWPVSCSRCSRAQAPETEPLIVVGEELMAPISIADLIDVAGHLYTSRIDAYNQGAKADIAVTQNCGTLQNIHRILRTACRAAVL